MSHPSKRPSFLKRHWLKMLLGVVALLVLLSALANYWIIHSTRNQLYADITLLPGNDIALVLGASSGSASHPNLYFRYRMEAAAQLFHAGKVKHLIVSGDNHREGYDEATDMRDALMKLGVPEQNITLDYAGFRTLDSVVRCWKIFGKRKITIVSQAFHNQRALFIANKYALDAVAYNAQDVPSQYRFKTRVREYLAKFKAVLDVYVFHTGPKFLGKPVDIAL
jgi:SanA protein